MDNEFLERHRRHLLLKDIGGPGLAKLRAARISLVGAGALGGPAALYLAAAGVGTIDIWDDDTVDLSNLQRQVQFSTGDIGARKVDMLAARLAELNPDCIVNTHASRVAASTEIAGEILLDATDNYQTRFALNALAHTSRRHLVSGAAIAWTGQVSVFSSGLQNNAPCYRCLVPQEPPAPADCSTEGVVGAVTGIVGARMALECLKLITGAGEPLIGRLWRFDGLSGETKISKLRPDPECSVCGP
ncbi:MAG: ThiF family adenylyltransferase [Pseudomonadota bacterium]